MDDPEFKGTGKYITTFYLYMEDTRKEPPDISISLQCELLELFLLFYRSIQLAPDMMLQFTSIFKVCILRCALAVQNKHSLILL